MSHADQTAGKQRVIGRPFVKGVSGNPLGRPKGARSRLSTDFLDAMASDFAEHGRAAIERVRQEKPEAYIRACVDLLPRHSTLDVDVMHGVDALGVLASFRQAVELLQADAPVKVIDGKRS